MIAVPGANKSRHVPVLLNIDLSSSFSVAPTVIALLTLPGLKPQASILSFPAEVTTVTPSLIKLFTAVCKDAELDVPKDIFTTAGIM